MAAGEEVAALVGGDGHVLFDAQADFLVVPFGDAVGDGQFHGEAGVGDEFDVAAAGAVFLFPGQADEGAGFVEQVAEGMGIDAGLGQAAPASPATKPSKTPLTPPAAPACPSPAAGGVKGVLEDLVAGEAGAALGHEGVLEAVALGEEIAELGGGLGFAGAQDIGPFLMVGVQAQVADSDIAMEEVAGTDEGIVFAEFGEVPGAAAAAKIGQEGCL